MKKKSLQQIEDFYINMGYQRGRLRKILAGDQEYQELLKERERRLTKRFGITPAEKKRYVLSTDADFEILAKSKQLEKSKLTKEERTLVKLVKTQLEADWRKALLERLDRLLRKYGRR